MGVGTVGRARQGGHVPHTTSASNHFTLLLHSKSFDWRETEENESVEKTAKSKIQLLTKPFVLGRQLSKFPDLKWSLAWYSQLLDGVLHFPHSVAGYR